MTAAMLRCRLLGHRLRFAAEGTELRWDCARGCGAAGKRRYERAEDARRYARALSREPSTERRVLPGLPLWLADLVRGRRS
jgi:hypothetical protein